MNLYMQTLHITNGKKNYIFQDMEVLNIKKLCGYTASRHNQYLIFDSGDYYDEKIYMNMFSGSCLHTSIHFENRYGKINA